MDKIETLEEFYKRKFNWLPENIRNDIGHFNVFRLTISDEHKLDSIPYRRRDFYKIMLLKGNSLMYYADQVFEVKKQALVFSNPFIPYTCENLEKAEIFYCIFNQHFFTQFGNINQYEIFLPGGTHVFELQDEQGLRVQDTLEKMEAELKADYKYKYDVIKNLVFELIHFGLKLKPNVLLAKQSLNSAQRISSMFLELLERQFPIDDNHLNRSVKNSTQKTTTQIIAERLVQESKVLLKYSTWSVSEIAYALGFTEVTHFDNFFKKHAAISPLKFRNG
jgi:AraC-like DNA-binding protein